MQNSEIPLMGWETAHLYKNMNNEPPLLFDYPGLPEWKKGTYAAWEIEICQKELTARWLFARDHGVETMRGVWPRPVPEHARQFYYDLVEMPAWEVCAPILAAHKPAPARRRHPILDSPFASDDYKAGLKAQLLAAGEIDDDGYYIEPAETGPVAPAEWAAPAAPAAPPVSPWQPSAQPPEQTQPRPAVDPQPPVNPPTIAATVPLQNPAPAAPTPAAVPAREKVGGTMPAVAMTYMVYFEEHGIIKVGRAYKNSRWRSLVARGAELIFLDRDTIAKQEQAALALLRQVFPPAFQSENDELAQQLLPLGRGFTECFKVSSVEEFNLAFNLYMQGVDEHAAEAAEVAAEYRLHRKAARSAAASGEVHSSWNEDARGRRRALQTRPAPNPVDDLPPRSADERGRAAKPPAAVDSKRLATCVSSAGRGMAGASGAVASGSACEAVTAGGAAESATVGGTGDANIGADSNSGSTEAATASHAANLADSRAGKPTGHRRTGGSKRCAGRSAAVRKRRADTRTGAKATSRVLPTASKAYTSASFTKPAGAGVTVLHETSAVRDGVGLWPVPDSALQLRNAARKSARGAGAFVGAGHEPGRGGRIGRGVERRAGNHYRNGYTGYGVQSPAAVPGRAGDRGSGRLGAVLNNSGAGQGEKPVNKRDFVFHESFMKSSWLWREGARARGSGRASARVRARGRVGGRQFCGKEFLSV